MYRLKSLVPLDTDVILPDCMYSLKKIAILQNMDDMEVNISNQQGPSTKMTELEERQDILLKKLDVLYERIKSISSNCKLNNTQYNSTSIMVTPKEKNIFPTVSASREEIVVVLSPDSLPWFLNFYLRHKMDINISWHIHSSVPRDKKPKIQAFFKRFAELYPLETNKPNLRLIFKNVAADSELKLSSLEIPIIGTVNILRYLALIYPNGVPYDFRDYQVDALLDLCHLLERCQEKNKEAVTKKLFAQYRNWIYGNSFSIIDLAVYNIVKQWQNNTKFVPKTWFENCEKIVI